MNENIQAFLKKFAEDAELAAKFRAIRNPDEAWELASSLQGGFTKEEFLSAMEQLKAAAENTGDLSDEDLSKFAGGDIDWSEVGITGGASAASAASAVGAALAAI